MRVFSYEEFFSQPLVKGRFWWTDPGHVMLLQWGYRKGQHIMLYTSHAPNNWAKPGGIEGWDGNLDEPTLHPSIGVWNDDMTAFQFHGFLERGILSDA